VYVDLAVAVVSLVLLGVTTHRLAAPHRRDPLPAYRPGPAIGAG
jgi:hypothetical protein